MGGRGMQWYVYLIAIPAAAFLTQAAVDLVGRPLRTIFRLRRTILERMYSFGNISLPRPRELAISSREIREYDHAVRNVKKAHCAFCDLGTQLLAFSENEPAIHVVMALLGFNIAIAGRELINLSEIYASPTTDSDKLRREIEKSFRAARAAMAVSPHPSRDNLIRIRLEPMCLRDGIYPRKRNRPPGQRRMVSLRTPHQALGPHRLRQAMREPIASSS